MISAILDTHPWLQPVVLVALDVTAKSVVLLAFALATTAILGRKRMLARSALWNACVLGLLVLPITSACLPRLRIAILPPAPVLEAVAVVEEPAFAPTLTNVLPAIPLQVVEPAPYVALSPPPPKPVDWVLVSLFFYMAGATLLALRLTLALIDVQRLRRSSRAVSDAQWQATLATWTQRLGITAPVQLLASSRVGVPIAFGWLRPAIAIPTRMVEATIATRRSCILLHEAAHIRRNDYLWQVLLKVLQIVYWPNPLIWLAGRQIAANREATTDALCVYHAGSPDEYHSTLIEVARSLVRRPAAALGIAMARTPRIAQRLERINQGLRVRNCLAGRPVRSILTLGAVLIAGVVGACQLAAKENAAPTGDPVVSTKPTTQPWTNATRGCMGYAGVPTSPAPPRTITATGSNATLPSGATVEFLGIHALPEKTGWWGLDGSDLKEAPCDPGEPRYWDVKKKGGTFVYPPDVCEYQFVLRVTGPNGIQEVFPQVIPWTSNVDGARHTQSSAAVSRNGQPVFGLRSVQATCASDKATTTMLVGLASGKWKTLAASTGGITSMTVSGQSFLFSNATETQGSATVSVTDNPGRGAAKCFDNVARIVAIDTNNQIHETPGVSSVTGEGVRLTQVIFPNLPLRDVKEFQFQTCDYEWVRFPDIPLKPGMKTTRSAADIPPDEIGYEVMVLKPVQGDSLGVLLVRLSSSNHKTLREFVKCLPGGSKLDPTLVIELSRQGTDEKKQVIDRTPLGDLLNDEEQKLIVEHGDFIRIVPAEGRTWPETQAATGDEASDTNARSAEDASSRGPSKTDQCFVYLTGNSRRPGVYSMNADSRLTLSQLVAAGGGPEEAAGPRTTVEILRHKFFRAPTDDEKTRSIVKIPLSDLAKPGAADPLLENGDRVRLSTN